MFRTYEFTYAGIPSSLYGMVVTDQWGARHSAHAFGTQASIAETRIPNRIAPLHYGVNYHEAPLEFKLVFGVEYPMDRYQLQEIALWLTGHQEYQWMSIDQPDMEDMQFRCLIQRLTPVHVQRLPLAFEAEIVCDCPYAYSYPFKEVYSVSGGETVRFYNDSTCREPFRPALLIEPETGCADFSVRNLTTGGEEMAFTGLPAGEPLKIQVDNENQIVTEEAVGYNLYDYFNFHFLEFAPGDNELQIQGEGTLTIHGRYLYNVGA